MTIAGGSRLLSKRITAELERLECSESEVPQVKLSLNEISVALDPQELDNLIRFLLEGRRNLGFV